MPVSTNVIEGAKLSRSKRRISAKQGGVLPVRRLIEHIQADNLKSGDRLPSIRELSQKWRVAPHTVRDALLAAQTKGIIKVHPRAGAFVQSVDFGNLVDALDETLETAVEQANPRLTHLIDARQLLEVEVVGLAAELRRAEDLGVLERLLEEMDKSGSREEFVAADEKFHLAIASLTGNPVLVTMLRSLLVLLRPYRINCVPTPQERETTNQTHKEIYRCLREGDSAGAKAAVSKHWTER